MWLTLLNDSYFEKYTIKKGDIIGYLVIEPEDLKVHYKTKKKPPNQTRIPPDNYLPKEWNWKKFWEKKKKTGVSSSTRRVFK